MSVIFSAPSIILSKTWLKSVKSVGDTWCHSCTTADTYTFNWFTCWSKIFIYRTCFCVVNFFYQYFTKNFVKYSVKIRPTLHCSWAVCVSVAYTRASKSQKFEMGEKLPLSPQKYISFLPIPVPFAHHNLSLPFSLHYSYVPFFLAHSLHNLTATESGKVM